MREYLTAAALAAAALATVSAGCGGGDAVVTEEPSIPENPSVWNMIAVTGSVVNLRSGPGTEYAVVGQVTRDDTLQVTGGLEDWYRVYVPDVSMFAWIYGPLTTGTELP